MNSRIDANISCAYMCSRWERRKRWRIYFLNLSWRNYLINFKFSVTIWSDGLRSKSSGAIAMEEFFRVLCCRWVDHHFHFHLPTSSRFLQRRLDAADGRMEICDEFFLWFFVFMFYVCLRLSQRWAPIPWKLKAYFSAINFTAKTHPHQQTVHRPAHKYMKFLIFWIMLWKEFN